MNQFIATEDLVLLEVENKTLRCSKKCLAGHSDYFKVMFEGNFVEKNKTSIKLEDIELNPFQTILKLITVDNDFQIEEDCTLMLDVLKTASMLQFLKIKETVVDMLDNRLSPKNCIEIWLVTELFDIDDLPLKAKSMALLEFDQIKDTDAIYSLTLKQLFRYLANTQLQCKSEMDVFQAGMKWFYENVGRGPKEPNEEYYAAALHVLHCVDFNNITESDLSEMITYPDIGNQPRIVKIIQGILCMRQKHTSCKIESCKVDNWLSNSRSRTLKKMPCILYEKERNSRSDHTYVFYYDERTKQLSKLVNMGDKCKFLEGFRIVGHKDSIYLYGGEHLLGTNVWHRNLWVYDMYHSLWRRENNSIPSVRRHFETCVSGDRIFVVCGTGKYRIVHENMFWYDIKKEVWCEPVQLPSKSRRLKCCDCNGRLLLLEINTDGGRAFTYDADSEVWRCYEICDTNNLVSQYPKDYAVFYYKGGIYIKGNNLIKLECPDDNGNKLGVVSCRSINAVDCSRMDAVLCDNVVYTVYKTFDPQLCMDSVTLERFCVDTLETEYVFKDAQAGEECVNKIMYKMPVVIFSVHHYSLVADDAFVNDLQV